MASITGTTHYTSGAYSSLPNANMYGHAYVERPFPSGGIAYPSGQAMFEDAAQRDFNRSYPDPTTARIGQSGLLYTEDIIDDFATFNGGTLHDHTQWHASVGDLAQGDKLNLYPNEKLTSSHPSQAHPFRGILDFTIVHPYVWYYPHPDPPTNIITGLPDYGFYQPALPEVPSEVFNTYKKNRHPNYPETVIAYDENGFEIAASSEQIVGFVNLDVNDDNNSSGGD